MLSKVNFQLIHIIYELIDTNDIIIIIVPCRIIIFPCYNTVKTGVLKMTPVGVNRGPHPRVLKLHPRV